MIINRKSKKSLYRLYYKFKNSNRQKEKTNFYFVKYINSSYKVMKNKIQLIIILQELNLIHVILKIAAILSKIEESNLIKYKILYSFQDTY